MSASAGEILMSFFVSGDAEPRRSGTVETELVIDGLGDWSAGTGPVAWARDARRQDVAAS